MGIIFGRARPVSFVKEDFTDHGIKVGWLTRRRLSNYPQERYRSILFSAQQLSERYGINRIKIDALRNMSQIDIGRVPDKVLEDNFIKGRASAVLDLRGLEVFWQVHQAEAGKQRYLEGAPTRPAVVEQSTNFDMVREMVRLIGEERDFFNRLLEDPETTSGQLYKALAFGIAKFKDLGFHATIFRPLIKDGPAPEEWRWQEFYRAEQWGVGSYTSADGALPTATLLSILRSSKTRFKVDLKDEESFRAQGLAYNPVKLAYDLEHSKGSPETLIYKLESAAGNPFAIIYINNRVKKERLSIPSEHLFPLKDAELIAEQINTYFETVARAYDKIRERREVSDPFLIRGERGLTNVAKKGILQRGELITRQDQRARLLEAPSEKFYDKIGGVVEWWRETILSVYEGTKLAEGKTREELIKILSLENDKMLERVIYARYVALIEGPEYSSHELRGMVSGTVLENIKDGPAVVFKVPEAMIRKEARGRKLEVALAYEMARRVFQKRWAEIGFIKGFFHMLRKGLPFYATTQSLRVAKDLLRLKDTTFLRTIQGKKLSAEQRAIIKAGSKRKADERGVELNAYGGRIAIDEEEKDVDLLKPNWFLSLPLVRLIFKNYHKKIADENARIKKFFKDELGENGRLHIVGYFTLGVAFKVGLELASTKFSRKLSTFSFSFLS